MVRPLLALGALCFVPLVVQAQSSESVLHPGVEAGLCGGEFFKMDDALSQHALRKLTADPAAHARATMKISSSSRSLQVLGDVETFYVLNRVSQSFDEVDAVLRFQGRRARIWVDARDTSRVSSAIILQLARGVDSTTGAASRNMSKGIIENDLEVFGETPKAFEIAGKTDFLLTDIQDGMSGGAYVAGYFSPRDQSREVGSNARNLLYIDSRQGLASGVQALLSIIAHEFQHLIHHNTNPNAEPFFNEGCSEVASILCGFRRRGNTRYMANTNVDFFTLNFGQSEALLADYERAMTFHYYLYEQFGEAFLREFTTVDVYGFSRVNLTLQRLGLSDNHQDVLMGFAVANTVRSGLSNSRFRYDVRLSAAIPRALATYDTILPGIGNTTLDSYGISYLYVRNPSTMSVRFTGSGLFRVMAILHREDVATDVIEVERNTDCLLNGDRSADLIIFCVISMSGHTADVGWRATELPAGMDDEMAVGNLADAEVVSKQVGGALAVSLTLHRPGLVRMELFDVAGRLVRRLLEGRWIDAGRSRFDVDVRGLASGCYLLRTALPGYVVSRQVTLW